jgi:hypothetical protein
MSFQEKSIQCSDCGTSFTFSAGEQEFYRTKGFTEEPKRCPACRAKRKTQNQGSNSGSYKSRSW